MKISERIPLTEHTLRLQAGKKVYFVSDVHLGAPVLDNDRERENRLIRWLDTIRTDGVEPTGKPPDPLARHHPSGL